MFWRFRVSVMFEHGDSSTASPKVISLSTDVPVLVVPWVGLLKLDNSLPINGLLIAQLAVADVSNNDTIDVSPTGAALALARAL
eukprot:scaffold2353_cov167-Amphora_coffeaeformis.AAC.74